MTRETLRIANRRARGWATAYEELLAAVEGRKPRAARRQPPQDPVPRDVKRRLKRHDPPLVTWLRQGVDLEVAAARTARELLQREGVAAAQSFTDSLVDQHGAGRVADLAAAIVANHRKLHTLALHHFAQASVHHLWAEAGAEYVQSTFAVDRDRGLESVPGWLSDPPEGITAKVWFEMFKHVMVHGEPAVQHALYERVTQSHEREGGDAAWKAGSTEIAWVRHWVGAERGRTAAAPRAGRIPFGVIDYVQPGRGKTSQNIGDHIQTLASMGHVVRRRGLTFHGDPEIAGFLREMQQRVPDELRLDGDAAEVEVVKIDRDASTYQAFPERTWALAFGWHMHDLFGVGTWDFPLHPNIRPILVSFHCNKRGLLTTETIDYLKRYGPVGCRDWTTVDLLLSLGVPAFFSGCLTTTVSTVFPRKDRPSSRRTAYVDVRRSPVPAGEENIRQSYPRVKDRTFVENMREAVRLLEWYRTEFTDVVTTRLHCYLPTRSLGLDVHFEPKNNADVRFNGLFRLGTAEFDTMRTRMIERLEPVLTAVFGGAEEDEVYRIWQETVADEVEFARSRHHDDSPVVERRATARDVVAPVLQGTDPVDDLPGATDVVLTPREDELGHVARAAQTVLDGASGPVRVWVVGRGVSTLRPSLAATGAQSVHLVETSKVGPAPDGVAPYAQDRALLPELLPSVRRAVLLPVAATVLGDVSELASLDLGDDVVAGRTTRLGGASGFAILYAAALRLDTTPDTAFDFYRRIHSRHVFDFDAFDTEVLVADLAALRERGFSDDVLAHMEAFGLDDREALHLYVGPHRAPLPARWDFVPTREVLDDASLWHWADKVKPWSTEYTRGQSVWSTAHAGTTSR